MIPLECYSINKNIIEYEKKLGSLHFIKALVAVILSSKFTIANKQACMKVEWNVKIEQKKSLSILFLCLF